MKGFIVIVVATAGIGFFLYQSTEGDLLADKKMDKQIAEAKVIDIANCNINRQLAEIDIEKENVSTNEIDQFLFYARLTNPQESPADLLYRWQVRSPKESKITTDPVFAYRLNLEPDVIGAYHIILSIADRRNDCKHSIFVFHYPELELKDPTAPQIIQAKILDLFKNPLNRGKTKNISL